MSFAKPGQEAAIGSQAPLLPRPGFAPKPSPPNVFVDFAVSVPAIGTVYIEDEDVLDEDDAEGGAPEEDDSEEEDE